jgi:hypothetical protein
MDNKVDNWLLLIAAVSIIFLAINNMSNHEKQIVSASNALIKNHNLPEGITYKCIAGKVHYKVDVSTNGRYDILQYEPLIYCKK